MSSFFKNILIHDQASIPSNPLANFFAIRWNPPKKSNKAKKLSAQHSVMA